MNGRHIGQLSVVIQQTDGTNTTFWSLNKSQGDKWLQAQVPIPAYAKKLKNYKVCVCLCLSDIRISK